MKKVMHCIIANTMRNLVQQANDLEISKEDIVGIHVLGEQLYLVYFK